MFNELLSPAVGLSSMYTKVASNVLREFGIQKKRGKISFSRITNHCNKFSNHSFPSPLRKILLTYTSQHIHIYKQHLINIQARISDSILPHHYQRKANPPVQANLDSAAKKTLTYQNLGFRRMKNSLSILNLFVFNKRMVNCFQLSLCQPSSTSAHSIMRSEEQIVLQGQRRVRKEFLIARIY